MNWFLLGFILGSLFGVLGWMTKRKKEQRARKKLYADFLDYLEQTSEPTLKLDDLHTIYSKRVRNFKQKEKEKPRTDLQKWVDSL